MGELYIGGAGVARGYLNRPELTAERFLADPFSGRPGARMYKTGDLARLRADGILEYLGRTDNQVKVRGYRIELGEIEATLAGHEHVQSCAVLAREDTPGDKQLVGYVVARRGTSPSAAALQQYLGARMPEYMVPAHLVMLDAFPLTENGKVDRAALPAPSHGRGATTDGAQSETEQALAATWIELLNVDHVGSTDSFFELGGHSLLAMKAVAKIREVFHVDLELANLFECPTLSELAGLIDGMR